MKKIFYLILCFLAGQHGLINAQENASCHEIRFSDVGWSDISVTTALASIILETLGYKTKTSMLSVPVTFMSLKNQDIDVFLGDWQPSMAADIKPYLADNRVEVLSTLLSGSRYMLAVPRYVYDGGVHSISDLAKFNNKFSKKIYGIEPGNDGNRLIQKIIGDKNFNLTDWKLVESSEQAMLMQVMRAVKTKDWIVFLGWEPHPMNKKIDMVYLDGGDAFFGPNKGQGKVYINTRKEYAKQCPVAAGFLKQFSLTVDSENTLMSLVLDEKKSPREAAEVWLKENIAVAKPWLHHVTALNGENGYDLVLKKWGQKL